MLRLMLFRMTLLLAIAALAAAPNTVLADDFCIALKAAASDAPNGFASLLGSPLGVAWDDHGGDDETRYAAARALPGALGCGVDKDHADGEDLLTTYVCWFAASPTKAAAVARVGRRVTDCLGLPPGAARLSSGHGGGVAAAFDLDRPTYAIDVSANAAPTVVFQISGK
jgi:hypothetical protein